MKLSIAILSAPLINLLLGVSIILPFSVSAQLVQRAEVQNAIPSDCAGTCDVIATALETCEYGDCLCTNSNAQGLEDCLSCLYEMSSISSVYGAVQDALSEFDKTCSAFIDDISLTITGPGNQMCMVVNRNSLINKSSGGAPSSSAALSLHVSYPYGVDAGIATAAIHNVIVVLAVSFFVFLNL